MKKIYISLLVVLMIANCTTVNAQKKSSSSEPNIGIGLRLGDPTGITLKKYMGGKALELNIGRSYMFTRRGWYDKRFHDWYEGQKFGYMEFQYVGYGASAPVSIQLHYLFQKDLNAVENLQWYWGIGAQFRFQKYYFDYRYKLDGDPNWYYSAGERVTDIDLGADGVIGLEYKFSGIPISVFGDATLFMEIADNPFAFWLQGAIGARYNF